MLSRISAEREKKPSDDRIVWEADTEPISIVGGVKKTEGTPQTPRPENL